MSGRLIPVLLMDSDCRLVKTKSFGTRTYVGDPMNVVRLFNEMEVDELCLLDIDATREGRSPNIDFIEAFASECFMPLAYGGGIANLNQAHALNRIGVEKFVLGHHGLTQELVAAMVENFGSQALVACLDHKGNTVQNPCNTDDVVSSARALEAMGVGEIILQSVSRDGARTGYDLEVISTVARSLSIPLIALGGAGEWSHLVEALRAGAAAAASGSAFVFIGRLRAVLVSYPTHHEQLQILQASEAV